MPTRRPGPAAPADFNALVEVLQQSLRVRAIPLGNASRLLTRLAPMYVPRSDQPSAGDARCPKHIAFARNTAPCATVEGRHLLW